MKPEIKDNRQLRALTGIPTKKWDVMENAFDKALEEEKNGFSMNSFRKVNVSVNQEEVRKANYPQYMIDCFSCFITCVALPEIWRNIQH